MIFNKHSNFIGQHAFLSPSKYHWINYDEEKLDRVFMMSLAAQKGVELHDIAANLIRHRIKLPRSSKTINMYVNDAIGFRMTPELVLYYSDNCFGTCDALAFRKNTLMISDFKSGASPTSEHQLEVYAALFCLEYRIKPFEIGIELRIYQNDEVRIYDADPDVIFHIMDKIISFDKRITAMKMEAEL